MFNAFHVPLVNEHNDAVTISLVYLLEQFLVALVNKDALKFREVNISRLDVPI